MSPRFSSFKTFLNVVEHQKPKVWKRVWNKEKQRLRHEALTQVKPNQSSVKPRKEDDRCVCHRTVDSTGMWTEEVPAAAADAAEPRDGSDVVDPRAEHAHVLAERAIEARDGRSNVELSGDEVEDWD
jgi:hypothetical protein